MKRATTHLLFLLFLTITLNAAAQFKIVGYLNTWDSFPGNASNLDYKKLTHLNLAFANPDINGNLKVIPGLKTVVENAHAHDVKVLISLGGADLSDSKPNWQQFTKPDSVYNFCRQLLLYVQSNNLDGADVDLEGNIIGTEYGNFIYTLSSVFKPKHKLVTAALANWFQDQVPDSALQYFDFINLMCYDFTGPWDPAHPGQHAPFSMVVNDLETWKNKGLPADKIVIGVPFYGHGFYNQTTTSDFHYKNLIQHYPGAENTDQVADTIYYNGIPTIMQKTNYALQNAGGIMIWELSEDAIDDKSLLKAIYNTVHKL